MKKVGSRFIALACVLVLMLSMSTFMMSCGTGPGTQPITPQTADDFLAQHALVAKLGTEIAVMEVLKRNPKAEPTIVQLADILAKVNVPTIETSTLKAMVMKSIDMSRFSVEEQLIVGILLDEAVNQIEMQRTDYCKTHGTALLCLDQGAWVRTGQTYAHNLADWIKLGLDMYHQAQIVK